MIVRRGDILVSKTRPNRGAISFMDNDGVFVASTGFSIIREMKNRDVDKRYLFYFLRLHQSLRQMEQRSSGGNYPAITEQELGEIKIPIPPKEIQSRIVSNMDAAYAAQNQKKAEAQRLLDGIDDYLLSELGIEPPEPEESGLRSRIFFRNASEVSGHRLDPDYYRDAYKKLELAVMATKFPVSTLNEATTLIKNGNTPHNSDYSKEETPYPIIKAGSYEGDFIDLGKTGYTKTKGRRFAKRWDIFVLSAAHSPDYVGRSLKYLWDTPAGNTSFVGELICIRANESICNPIYLFSLLSTNLYKDLLNREKTGQTSHIYPKNIRYIQLPLPPLEKQAEIVDRIAEMRDRATELREEAKKKLEEASKEAEAMIFGG